MMLMQRYNRFNIKHILFVATLFLTLSPAQAQNLKIIFAGDLMGHMPQHNAARLPDGTYDYAPCFRYVKDYVKSADLAIVNLEVPLAGKPYSGYPQFSAPDELASAAKEAGFDIMTTANNHCMDRGKNGLERTLRRLDMLGIPHLGTYLNHEERDAEHPMIVEMKGMRIALLCYTYGTNGIEVQRPNVVNFIDTAEMSRDLRVAKERNADFIITLIHWGIEYAVHSNKEQEQTARWLLEHGCDAVIGGHPHVVQNFTLDAIPGNNRYPEVVVYSMGNLISNQRDVNTDGGIMVEMTLKKNDGKTNVIDCQYMPYWVFRGSIDGLYQYYIVPSADAVAHPESYQIEGSNLRALTTFDKNTRKRLADCVLPDGNNIWERQYNPFTPKPLSNSPLSTVPTLGNSFLRDVITQQH